MTDQVIEGSGNTGNPEGATNTAALGSEGGVVSDVWAGLQDADNRKVVEAKAWKSPDAAIGSYRELERYTSELKSKALVPPGDDAKPEDWTAFYSKLGRPEKAEAYEFKLPEGLPESFPYDGKSAERFKNWAFEAGLPPRQAQALHDQYVKDSAAQMQAFADAQAKQATEAHETLTKAWGDPSSDTYKRNQELANRAIRQSGGTELLTELKSVGALGPNGEVKTPRLAMALAKVGESLYAEDTMFGGPSGIGPNPFSDKSENLAEQGKIIRNDPERAKVLIRQAGVDPKEYGL
jgi:hypothetical protein